LTHTPTKSDLESLANVAKVLGAHNAWLGTKEGQLFIAREWLNFYRLHYRERRKGKGEKVGNLYPWFAYLECRRARLRVPKWVLEYFDDVAMNIRRMSLRPDHPHLGSEILAALGFKGRGKSGRGNIFARYLDNKDLMLSMQVDLCCQGGNKLKHAYEYIAKKNHVSEPTVRRAWAKYKYIYAKKLK
jgi:hypothetical protein